MAIRKEQATYTNCLNLKTALSTKGLLKIPDVNETYYSGGNTERHLLIADMSDGTFRTVVKTGSGMDFDFVDRDDAELVRMWTLLEISNLIGNFPGVQGHEHTKPGANYVCKIRYNGVDYVGADANLPNACCKAFINILNTL
jgi:hypothetical protein